jgi:hypothetical protein
MPSSPPGRELAPPLCSLRSRAVQRSPFLLCSLLRPVLYPHQGRSGQPVGPDHLRGYHLRRVGDRPTGIVRQFRADNYGRVARILGQVDPYTAARTAATGAPIGVDVVTSQVHRSIPPARGYTESDYRPSVNLARIPPAPTAPTLKCMKDPLNRRLLRVSPRSVSPGAVDKAVSARGSYEEYRPHESPANRRITKGAAVRAVLREVLWQEGRLCSYEDYRLRYQSAPCEVASKAIVTDLYQAPNDDLFLFCR